MAKKTQLAAANGEAQRLAGNGSPMRAAAADPFVGFDHSHGAPGLGGLEQQSAEFFADGSYMKVRPVKFGELKKSSIR